MKSLFYKMYSSLLLSLFIAPHALATSAPKLFWKSIGSTNGSQIWSIAGENFSDVRYDNNSDGIIDEWLLTKDNMKIDIYFQNSQIDIIKFAIKKNSVFIQSIYKFKNSSFFLAKSSFVDKTIFNMVEGIRRKGNTCNYANGDARIASDIAKLSENLSIAESSALWNSVIDSSCDKSKEEIQNALKSAFFLDFKTGIKTNNFIDCLSSNPQTNRLVAQFISMAEMGPTKSTVKKISCHLVSRKNCGHANFKSDEATIQLPLSTPSCSDNMEPIYRQQIYHEILHSISPTLPEKTISEIITICEEHRMNNLITLEGTDFDIGAPSNKPSENVSLSKEHQQNTIAEAAQFQVTNIPKTIAEGSLSIPSPEPQTTGMMALNNSFIQTRSPASTSVTIPLQQSAAMSAPFFKVAAQVFSNYKIEPSKASARVAPSAALKINSVASTDSRGSALIDAPDAAPNVANSFKDNSNKIDERGVANSASGSNSVAGPGSRGIASAGVSSKATISPASASPTAAAKSQTSDDANIAQERTQLAQNLVKMSPGQLQEYLRTNESKLDQMKILIFNQKNQRWGFKDPSRAAVRIQEVNGKLRIESQ